MTKKPTFEESIEIIDAQLAKRRSKWTLDVISWLDFDDVAQIIRIHLYKKWHLFDASQPLPQWINKVISNQIKNLIRNNYSNYSRPCLRCAASEGGDLCAIYQKQCSACPLYKKWESSKKAALDSKLPVSLETHAQEVSNMPMSNVDVDRSSVVLHEHMKKVLKPSEWAVYKGLFIEFKTEKEVAQDMDFRTSEKKGRAPGYRQICNIKKSIMTKVKKVVYGGDIDIKYQ